MKFYIISIDFYLFMQSLYKNTKKPFIWNLDVNVL